MKLAFLDVETTGRNPLKNEITEVSMIIDTDDRKNLKVINHKFRPLDFDAIEPSALEVTGLTIEELEGYPDRDESFANLIRDLDSVVDKYDSNDKMYAVAHNLWFDFNFLRGELFEKYNQKYNAKHYFFSYFHIEGFDTIPLMTQFKIILGKEFDNMRLGTLCKALKIKVDESKTHGALYDTMLLRKLFYKADAIMEKYLLKHKS